jgi:hypothetical protein
LAVTHIVDALQDSFSNLFRSHNHSPVEKLYSVVHFISRLNLKETKDRTKRFYNDMNSKKSKSVEELVTATANMRNVTRARGEEVILTRQYRFADDGLIQK